MGVTQKYRVVHIVHSSAYDLYTADVLLPNSRPCGFSLNGESQTDAYAMMHTYSNANGSKRVIEIRVLIRDSAVGIVSIWGFYLCDLARVVSWHAVV